MDRDLTPASCHRSRQVVRAIVENPARPLQPLRFVNRGSVYGGTGFHVQASMATGPMIAPVRSLHFMPGLPVFQ